MKKTKAVKNPKPKLPSLKVMQGKCDALMTPIAKLMNPKCEAECGSRTQVGHHWIEKSRSAGLRYDTDNIVSLCNFCHGKIHNNFRNNVVQSIDIALTIINKRGIKWYNKLNSMQVELSKTKLKTNRAYYEAELKRLTILYSKKN